MSAGTDFNEDIDVQIKIHDLGTNANWTAEIFGAADNIHQLLAMTERLVTEAGFVLGWRPDRPDRGVINYLVIVKEAVDRCWLARANHLVV